MQDVESHTIIYLRELLATRAVDEPDVATFLACWLYEETLHGLALARFLDAAGHPIGDRARPRGQEPFVKRLESAGVAFLSRAWPDFCALHMTWGAINELTALTGYRRLAKLAGHPVLSAAARAHHAGRVAALLLLLPAGRGAPPAAGRRPGRPPDRGPLLGSGRERRAGPARSSASWPATSSAATRDAPPPARSTRPSAGCRASRPCGWSRPGSTPSPIPGRAPPRRKEDGMATMTAEPYRAYKPRPFTRAERDSTTVVFGGLHWRLERLLQAVLENSGYKARILPRGHQGGSPHRPRGRGHRAVLPDELHDREPRQLPRAESKAIGAAGGERSATST